MQVVLKILVTLFLFGVLIFIHELGHYLTARWSKIKIEEFSIGMGPAVFKWTKNDIQYSIRALPIGGFVNMDGEDGDGTSENSFNRKPKWVRFIVLASGAFNNIVFGFLISCILYGFVAGFTLFPTTIVAEFNDNSVSDSCGLQVNDLIYKVDGYRIFTFSDLSFACAKEGTNDLDMVVIRNSEKVYLDNVKLPTSSTDYAGEYNSLDFKVYGYKKTVWNTIDYAFKNTLSVSRSIYNTLGSLFTGKADLHDFSGPIGTTKVIGTAVKEDFGIDFTTLLFLFSLISINLGIMNLLPFPALDGGRIFLILIEAIFHKKLSEKVEGAINTAGFVLLMAFTAVITIKDIIQIF